MTARIFTGDLTAPAKPKEQAALDKANIVKQFRDYPPGYIFFGARSIQDFDYQAAQGAAWQVVAP
jgi:hypothetical protein